MSMCHDEEVQGDPEEEEMDVIRRFRLTRGDIAHVEGLARHMLRVADAWRDESGQSEGTPASVLSGYVLRLTAALAEMGKFVKEADKTVSAQLDVISVSNVKEWKLEARVSELKERGRVAPVGRLAAAMEKVGVAGNTLLYLLEEPHRPEALLAARRKLCAELADAADIKGDAKWLPDALEAEMDWRRGFEEALNREMERSRKLTEALEKIADSGHGTAGGYEGDVARSALARKALEGGDGDRKS